MIEPTQQSVIDYVVARPKLQIVMGTNNSALAQGGFGTPWSPGLMNSKDYTDKWVSMLIGAFGSADAVKTHLGTVLIGNEIDANGPPPSDAPIFNAYLNVWIPNALNNLKLSMAAQGFGSIPVSTIIANYPSDPSVNPVASKTTSFVTNSAYWSSAWNSGHPFLMFNQYTLNNGVDPNFAPVATYFENLGTAFNHRPDVFVGETGFSAEFGAGVADEGRVLGEMFAWAGAPLTGGKLTIPVFAFDAFDLPDKPPGQKKFAAARLAETRGRFRLRNTAPPDRSRPTAATEAIPPASPSSPIARYPPPRPRNSPARRARRSAGATTSSATALRSARHLRRQGPR
jgi:hypothetical protein